MSVLPLLFERAKAAAKTIVLPEGQDPRVISAACKALDLGIAKKVIVLGSEAEIAEAAAKAGIAERPYEAIGPLNLLEHPPQNQNLSVLLFCAFHQLF